MSYQEVHLASMPAPLHVPNQLGRAPFAGNRLSHPIHPKRAAKQALELMRIRHQHHIHQVLLPPPYRPALPPLAHIGFTNEQSSALLAEVSRHAPELLTQVWQANLATTAYQFKTCPSTDSGDGRVHILPANRSEGLISAYDSEFYQRIAQHLFADQNRFVVHSPIAGAAGFCDHGSAQHFRLSPNLGAEGFHLLAFGIGHNNQYWRHGRHGLQAAARLFDLAPNRHLIAGIHPDAIEAGVWGIDELTLASGNFLLFHQRAFIDSDLLASELLRDYPGKSLELVCISQNDVRLNQAINANLFTSALHLSASGHQHMIVRDTVERQADCAGYIEGLVNGNGPIHTLYYQPMDELLGQFGGPGTCSVKLILSEAERHAMPARSWLDERKFEQLEKWIESFFSDDIGLHDLGHDDAIHHNQQALSALLAIAGYGELYDFQQV